MAKKILTPEQRAKFSKVGRSNVRTSKVHERRCARLMTAWSGVPFRRRRVEGREGAVRIVELVADVIPCVGDFHFSIECKKGKDFSFEGLMMNPAGSQFTEWWHQACYDAKLVTGDMRRPILPFMFFKPHPNWDWVAFSTKALGVLRPRQLLPGLSQQVLARTVPPDYVATYSDVAGDSLWNSLWFPHLRFDAFGWLGDIEGNVSHSKKHKKLVKLPLDPVFICRWRDFAANVAPDSSFLKFPDAAELASVQPEDEAEDEAEE